VPVLSTLIATAQAVPDPSVIVTTKSAKSFKNFLLNPNSSFQIRTHPDKKQKNQAYSFENPLARVRR
jgi:uncharacterized protein YpiB (UPF0302 family)